MEKFQDSFIKNGTRTAHTFHEGVDGFDRGFEVIFPTLSTKSMSADVAVEGYIFGTTDVTCAYYSGQLIGIGVGLVISDFVFILLDILKVVSEFFNIPLKFAKKQ